MMLREFAGEQNIWTKLVKTEAFPRYVHRFNMTTARDDVSKAAPIFIGCVQGMYSTHTEEYSRDFVCFMRRYDFMSPFQ